VIQAWFAQGLEDDEQGQDPDPTTEVSFDAYLCDTLMVVSMLVPLDIFSNVNPITGRQGKHKRHWYSCVHYDEDSGDCTNHEDRPQLCRGYPYGRACEEPECTWEAGASCTKDQRGSMMPLVTDEVREWHKQHRAYFDAQDAVEPQVAVEFRVHEARKLPVIES
jgi:Fe-S-cluster containining protein